MKVKPLFALLVAVAVAACSEKDTEYVLDGMIACGGCDSVIVTGFDSRFDRTEVVPVSEGAFRFCFNPDTVTPLLLVYPNGDDDIVFADRNVSAVLSKQEWGVPARVSGTVYDGQYAAFNDSLEADTAGPDGPVRLVKSFVQAHPFSEVTPYIVHRYMVRRPDTGTGEIQEVIALMSGRMTDNELISGWQTRIKQTDRLPMQLEDCTLTDTLGRKIRLSNATDEKGMLVCIWASWDEESCKGPDELSALSREFSGKSIEFIAISIDVDRDKWLGKVRGCGGGCLHLADLNGWSSQIVTQFGITRLPYYIYTGPQRRVIGRGKDTSGIREKMKDADTVRPAAGRSAAKKHRH